MRPHSKSIRTTMGVLAVLGVVLAGVLSGIFFGGSGTEPHSDVETSLVGGEPESRDASAISGEELFHREWLPNDPRSHGGDGLGPVFNDSSCIACHNQGGPGGSGPAAKNVDIASIAISSDEILRDIARRIQSADQQQDSGKAVEEFERIRNRMVDSIKEIHPGFMHAHSVVLHKFGTESEFASWRAKSLRRLSGGAGGAFGHEAIDAGLDLDERRVRFALSRSFGRNSLAQRNPTALFGAGLIDAIPAATIEQAAKQKFEGFPKVSGRAARRPDGSIGRFGWKAQQGSLHDFTMTACAVELGLNVPDHPQSGVPYRPTYLPEGFDLDRQECDALVAYLRQLPAPSRRKAACEAEEEVLREGADLFVEIGCAACHVERLGDVTGIFSDLLLHDMGPALGDVGSYGAFTPGSPSDEADGPVPTLAQVLESLRTEPGAANMEMKGAERLEWRTPPLWGVRDSAPYLHDGRAQNLGQAIVAHGGEAADSARLYSKLSFDEQQSVQAFLKSLVAPAAREEN